MSSIENVSPEPKKLFLSQLLFDDQEAGHLFIAGRYRACVSLMDWIVMRISSLGLPKAKIEPLAKKLSKWSDTEPDAISKVREARKELSELLSENFYSELHLGLIQTSTLPETKPKPKNEPVPSELSSRLS